MLAYLHSSNFLFRDKEGIGLGGGLEERKTHPKSLHFPVHPYPKNAQVQKTPASLMGKMIPDVPWGPDACSSGFTGNCLGGMLSLKATYWHLT